MIPQVHFETGGEAESSILGDGPERTSIDPDKLAEPSENGWAETASAAYDYVEADRVAEPYLTTYKERLDQCPKDLFEDPSLRGESLARPDMTTEKGRKAAEKLAEYGQDGIMYGDALADFESVSECTVQIGDMTSNRARNFDQADILCAEKWNAEKRDGRSDWTDDDVKQWRKDNGFSWHECADMETMNLVSRDIHEYFTHSGGVAECKRREGVIGNGGYDE